MYKKSLIALAAFSMLTVPVIEGQAGELYSASNSSTYESSPLILAQYREHRAERRHERRQIERHHRYRAGQKMADWRRYKSVQNYRRYGLRAPGRGQHWVRVGNEYLLVAAATGLIIGMAAAR